MRSMFTAHIDPNELSEIQSKYASMHLECMDKERVLLLMERLQKDGRILYDEVVKDYYEGNAKLADCELSILAERMYIPPFAVNDTKGNRIISSSFGGEINKSALFIDFLKRELRKEKEQGKRGEGAEKRDMIRTAMLVCAVILSIISLIVAITR